MRHKTATNFKAIELVESRHLSESLQTAESDRMSYSCQLFPYRKIQTPSKSPTICSKLLPHQRKWPLCEPIEFRKSGRLWIRQNALETGEALFGQDSKNPNELFVA